MRRLSPLYLAILATTSTAAAGLFSCPEPCDSTGTCCEPHGCFPKYEQEKVEKSGFETECEHICVPKVRFPWEDPCAPRCACLIRVNRLKKKTVECGEKTVLKWEAKPLCPPPEEAKSDKKSDAKADKKSEKKPEKK